MLAVFASLILSYTGMTGLALAMNKHYRQLRPEAKAPPDTQRTLLRLGGWALLIASAAICIQAEGVAIGLVLYCGALTVGSVIAIALLTFSPSASLLLISVAFIGLAPLAWMIFRT